MNTAMLNTKTAGLPVTTTTNSAGGTAYEMSAKQALAQVCLTGTLYNTYYVSAESQLATILDLCNKVDAQYIAKLAIYARREGYMKDTPAVLLAILATKDNGLLAWAFPQVVDNGRMLRNFVQTIRSGAVGRRSFGTFAKRLIQEWLESRDADRLFADSVGNTPSLADIIKMVHPRPKDKKRSAVYGYLIGKELTAAQKRLLPETVVAFEAFKAGKTDAPPAVPFEMLTALPLTDAQWAKMAENGNWHFTRMNLNTFERHGVYKIKGMVDKISQKLKDADTIAKARVFPYQLLATFLNTEGIPRKVSLALQDAMEIAVLNVPDYGCGVLVFPDVSGSMRSAITGQRVGATSKARRVDVAALVASAVLRKNPEAVVMPFEVGVVKMSLNPRDSVMTNAAKLASVGGGGTNCSAPLLEAVGQRLKADLVIYISDNESWVDTNCDPATSRPTETIRAWREFKRINPKAKMVCIDITPNTTTQAASRHNDILNIGGFSDNVFKTIDLFVRGALDSEQLVGEVDAINISGVRWSGGFGKIASLDKCRKKR